MDLTPRQQRALQSICDTFAPAAGGWPSAAELGIPEAIAKALDLNPRAGERTQFLQLLDIWDSHLHSLLSVGRWAAFSALPMEMRARVLLSWADSGLSRRRGVFQALRKAVGFLYVMLPGAGGGASAVWNKIDYPGPLGPQETKPRLLTPIVPQADTELSCDVCVVGSGAGGGVAAAVVAAAGKDVIVLEAGGYYDDSDFDGAELGGFQRLYLEGGFAATADQSVGLLAGECLGGGTVINYCTSFRTPDDVRAEWAAAGVPWFRSEEYTRSLDAVCTRLSVNSEHNRVSAREQVLNRGLSALGWHAAAMPRNVVDCEQGKICGYCGYGCSLGAKQSSTKTWLVDAQAKGARLVTETRAQRVRIEAGAATGVEARSRAGFRVTIRCKRVIVACGAIHTPALLLRSGLRNENIGRHLHLHPVSNVCGVFEEEIRPWEGTMQAIYSDEHRFLTGNYGVKYETTALQPVIAVAVLPWRGAEQYRSLLGKLSNTTAIGVLLRDRDGGRVTLDREGNPVTQYRLSEFDRGHLRKGFIGATRILEAAGARQIFSPHAKWCAYEPGRSGSLESFTQAMDAAGWDSGQLALFSFHIMGSARMGGSAKTSATNPEGETWEVRDLFVMDGASFPSASGVNPMISIEAIAHRNALGACGLAVYE
ncbi:MAG TPA: GMC family oxidoreductase N-terminal domain-containing protein [Candidatus Acidoferrum sp.]|nr:GMC family oxidoreductase N-terminal domain-containing protein [Candidatus Acidoferrum sp.]